MDWLDAGPECEKLYLLVALKQIANTYASFDIPTCDSVQAV
jgi:hypothetical protein